MIPAGARTIRRITGTAQLRQVQARAAQLNRTMLKVVFVVLAVSVFVYITGMARIMEGSQTINKLRGMINEQKGANQRLEIALEERMDKEMIKATAMSQLGMRYPTASVRVITLPGDVGNVGPQTVYDAAGESAAP